MNWPSIFVSPTDEVGRNQQGFLVNAFAFVWKFLMNGSNGLLFCPTCCSSPTASSQISVSIGPAKKWTLRKMITTQPGTDCNLTTSLYVVPAKDAYAKCVSRQPQQWLSHVLPHNEVTLFRQNPTTNLQSQAPCSVIIMLQQAGALQIPPLKPDSAMYANVKAHCLVSALYNAHFTSGCSSGKAPGAMTTTSMPKGLNFRWRPSEMAFKPALLAA